MAEAGKNMILAVGGWVVIKAVINLILGFGFGNFFWLFVALAAAVLLYMRFPYIQYAVSLWLGIVVIVYLPGNISNLPDTWFYLLEGVVDAVAILVLLFDQNVKAYLSGK